MSKLLGMMGRVLGGFVAFDVAGVALTLATELLAWADRFLETSGALGYAIWFVVGVFCGVFVYEGAGEPETREGRARGSILLAVTALEATALAALSSLLWPAGQDTLAVAPLHPSVTLTYLVTTTLTVAGLRFFVFREASAEPVARRTAPPAWDRSAELERALAPKREAAPPTDSEEFRPAGFWGTVGFVLGVPLLLFLDVSFFVLGPFDVFDPATDALLTGALGLGLVAGFAAARWERPRLHLFWAHVPLLLGTVFYFFGLLPGALFAAFDAPEWLSEGAPRLGFGVGFVLGCVALAGAFGEVTERWLGRGDAGTQNESTSRK